MDKKAVRGWMMYDWANSAFATTMMAAVLPIFYSDVAASTLGGNLATVYWGYTQAIAMLLVAVMSPILGAVADVSGRKLLFLRWFCYLGVLATALFVFVGEGDYMLASILLIAGTIGFTGGNIFYDAMLTDIVPLDQRDSVSAKGYAYGYVGGGFLLVVNLLMIQKPALFGLPDSLAGIQASFLSVAIWWLIFSFPIFRHVKDTAPQQVMRAHAYVISGMGRMWETLRHISRYPELLKYMVAFWFFNDGINTIITMATIYGKEIGIGTTDLIMALVITQFIGIPFSLLFGHMAGRIGSKSALYVSLSVYVLIVILGYFMTASWQFYALAVMVGFVQGGSQALGRSIFSRLVPPLRSAEFFGFLSVSSKFSSIAGPAVFAFVGQMTGSSRMGILSLVLFFGVGIVLLRYVDLDKGKREAGICD